MKQSLLDSRKNLLYCQSTLVLLENIDFFLWQWLFKFGRQKGIAHWCIGKRIKIRLFWRSHLDSQKKLL
ncbi:MAG: hypothetical protein WBA93_04660 [Microcoleaceae cyanobacterium]